MLVGKSNTMFGFVIHADHMKGLGVNLSWYSNFKSQEPMYMDLGLNYSYPVYSNGDLTVYPTVAIGPTLAIDPFKFHGFMEARASIVYKKVALSIGWHAINPEWKFKDLYSQCQIALGYSF